MHILKRTSALFAFLIASQAFTLGGADLSIHYEAKPAITYQDSLVLFTLFDLLDTLREDLETEVRTAIQQESSNISSVSVDFWEDANLRMEGLDGYRVRLTFEGLGGDIDFKVKCPLNIKKASVDVDLSKVEATAIFDVRSGLGPVNVTLHGFDVDIKTGISLCSVLSIYNLLFNIFGIDVEGFVEDLVEREVRTGVEDLLNDNLSIQGLGSNSFLTIEDVVSQIPSPLFSAIGLNRNDVIDVLINPFSGIDIRLIFDEDGDGRSYLTNRFRRDRLYISVDVPWEDPPIATFTHTDQGGGSVSFNASGSYDPDGGPIVSYQWNFGDGSPIRTTTTPYTNHNFGVLGVQTVTLIVKDDDHSIGIYNTAFSAGCQFQFICEDEGNGEDGGF